jgi:hypothetical protein
MSTAPAASRGAAAAARLRGAAGRHACGAALRPARRAGAPAAAASGADVLCSIARESDQARGARRRRRGRAARGLRSAACRARVCSTAWLIELRTRGRRRRRMVRRHMMDATSPPSAAPLERASV